MLRLCVCLGGLLACLWLACPSAGQPQPGGAQPPASARPLYKSPLGIAVDHQGTRAYVALRGSATVAVVDLEAGKVLHEVAVDRGPADLVQVGQELFVTCATSDTLVRVDLTRLVVSGRWTVGQSPRGVAALPDASR